MAGRRVGAAAAWCDGLLDAVVVLLATWTVVYHLCLVSRLGTTWALLLEVVALAATVVVLRRTCRRPAGWADLAHRQPRAGRTRARSLAAVAVGAAVVAAVSTAADAPFVLVWGPWLVSALSGTAWAARHLRTAPAPPRLEPVGPLEAGIAVGWALGLAVFSWWVLNPNADDLFYLNVSQEVADQGRFPLRDSLYSHLTLPMANWPPVASYDGLVGVVARLLGVRAGDVAYLAVLPIATALSVLALWRLLRAWRVPGVAWALSAALVFLLFDGGGSYATPGNLFVTRLWQGKIILLCVLVPMLLVYALRYVESPTRDRLVRLGLGSAAAVGLSTTAIFLVPVLALGGTAPLWRRAPRRALAGLAALAAYPLGAGLVTLLMGGRSADDFGERLLYRFDAAWIGHQIFLDGGMALLGVLAVLVGLLLVPHPAARVTTGVLVVTAGFVLVPGATRLSYDLTGLGPTLWRLSWVATVAALLGVGVAGGARWLQGRVPRPAGPLAGPATVAVTLGVVAALGTPVWTVASSGASIRAPFHWQRPPSSLTAADQVLRLAPPGSRVLAPDSLSIALAVSTTEVTTVAPREYYLQYLEHDPAFHYPERLALWHFVNDLEVDPPDRFPPLSPTALSEDLRRVGVDVVCTSAADTARYDELRALGLRPLMANPDYRCLRRT
jgi:hypothetical protein